jgi:hypothetical protein
VPSWAPSDAAPPTLAPLPRPHAEALLRLARLGHAQGLQRALDGLVGEHVEYEPQAIALRGLVARFAWSDLISRLASDLRVADGETAA